MGITAKIRQKMADFIVQEHEQFTYVLEGTFRTEFADAFSQWHAEKFGQGEITPFVLAVQAPGGMLSEESRANLHELTAWLQQQPEIVRVDERLYVRPIKVPHHADESISIGKNR